MQDYILWKTTFELSMTIFDEKLPVRQNDSSNQKGQWFKTTFFGRQHLMEVNLQNTESHNS